jgi:hypothetical protein
MSQYLCKKLWQFSSESCIWTSDDVLLFWNVVMLLLSGYYLTLMSCELGDEKLPVSWFMGY